MKRYSLYVIIFGIFGILIAVSFLSVYFSVTQHQKDLIETAIKEKTHLAETINETMASPIWIYRLALVPGMERAFISEMAEFEEVKYIRIVSADGTIYKSSLEEEWGKIIKELDVSKVISTREKIVKDQIFKNEKIKLIIYPGYEDKTIWVDFTLKGVETAIGWMWIRDFSIAFSGLLIMILALFAIFRGNIVDPLKKMTLACQEVRKGNLEVKVPAVSKTEIGELAETFNEMIKDLRKSHTALGEAKTVLEIKVEARTKELKEIAQGLEEEVKRRIKEVYEKMADLERFQRLAVGRELKMIELKKEIEKLKKELGK